MQGLMGLLSAGAIASFIVPVALKDLPLEFKFMSFATSVGFGSSLLLYAREYEEVIKDIQEEEEFYKIDKEIYIEALAAQKGAVQTQNQVLQEIASVEFVRQRLHSLYPLEEAQRFCQQYGIFNPTWVPPQQQSNQVTTTARVMQEEPQAAIEVFEDAPQVELLEASPSPYQGLRDRVSSLPDDVPRILEVEDLALTFAKSTLSTDTINNLLIVSEQGTGKSSLLCALMHKIMELTDNLADFTAIVGKRPKATDPGYCGLEKRGKDDYLAAWETFNVEDVFEKFKTLTDQAQKEYPGYPTITIQEEINNTFATMEIYEKENPVKNRPKNYMKELSKLYNGKRLTTGRSAGVIDIITSHSSDVQHIEYAKEYQHNFQRIILARANKYSMLSRSFTASLIPDPQVRQALEQKWNRYLQLQHKYNQSSIALTNAGTGKWRLVILPDYRPYTRPLAKFGILNSTTQEWVEEQYEDLEEKQDPWDDKPQEITRKPVGKVDTSDQKALYDALLEAIPSEVYSMERSQAVSILKQIIKEFWETHGEETTEELEIKLGMLIYDTKGKLGGKA